jgi:hypothetical protein
MPASLVQHQDNLDIGSGLLADKGQMGIHVIGVDGRGDQCRGIPRSRIDRSKYIDPFVFGLFYGSGTSSSLRPDRGQGSLLADPGFVLVPDLDGLLGVVLIT